MFKKSFFGFLLCAIIFYSNFSVSTSRWIFNFRSLLQESTTRDFIEKSNEINFSQPIQRNNSINTTESNILFWTIPSMSNTLEPDLQLQMETDAETTSIRYDSLDTNENTFIHQKPSKPTKMGQINEENKKHEALINASDVFDSKIDEKIVLHRNNCNMEISVREIEDLKVEIEFQKLENKTSGKCCITLNGQINSLLGVVISNIHLYRNASEGEVIKVIVADYGSDFVLKEYYSWSKYQPLLLTETHKVYIVLNYEVTNVPLNEPKSHFSLEVFNYHSIN